MSRHRVLVIGVGSIGERHVRCFQDTSRADLAICESEGTRRESVARQYGVEERFAHLDEALAASRPFDIAVVCTPADQHVELAIRLATAGIHLLIEKPLSTSFVGVDRLRHVVADKQIVAGVAYVYRHHPALAAMRDAIVRRQFGRPVELVATCGQHFPTYRPAYRDIYYAHRGSGGGAVQDALTHILNAGQWLVGRVDRLVADADHQVLPGVAVEDTVHVLTRHGDVMGSYSLNQHQAPNEVTISLICDQGTARFEYHLNRWRWMTQPHDPWHDEPVELPARDQLFEIQAHHFLDCVERGGTLACSVREAVHTLEINLAILASIESGTWQSPGAA
jgi:predicted dehydrogenase